MKRFFSSFLTLAAVAVVLAGCASGPGFDNLITKEGVGNLKFGMENPEMGEPFTTEWEKEYYMEDEYDEFIAVRDKDGNMAVAYHPISLMDVFSSEFETEEGLKPGMTIGEAMKILGDRPISIIMGYESGFIMEYDPQFAMEVDVDAMKGGSEAFQHYYMYADKELTMDDFEPAAKIKAIKVRTNE